jgi:TP901 family phage tail tape measure protein
MQKADASIATSEGVSVKAATNIGNAFLDTGGKVEFSGIKQAQAFSLVAGELKTTEGQALSTAQATTFMTSAMTLATATGTDLSDTTSTLAGVMQAFQLPLAQTASASNVLFNASRATGQGIDTLATSLEKTRSKLGETSPPLSQLTALIVDMTKAGITGRAALTGVNTAMTGLLGAATGTTKANLAANATLKQYGVNAVQANGQLTPMSTIIEKLAPKFATMTQAQQLATSSIIFGSSAAKQMTAVIDAGTVSFTKSTTAVNQNNAVTKAAAIQQGTLSGQLHILSAAVSDDGTKLGQVLIPALTDVAKAIVPVITGFTDVVGWFIKGSAGAHLVEAAIATVLAPALIKMGATAVAQAARSVVAFITMRDSATTTANVIDADMVRAEAGVQGLADETTAAAGTVAVEGAEIGASFTAMLGPIGIATAAIVLFHNKISAALTDFAKYTGLTAAGNAVNNALGGLTGSVTSGNIQSRYDQALKGVKNQKELDILNKGFDEMGTLLNANLTTQNKYLATALKGGPLGHQFGPSTFTDTKTAINKQLDAYIPPANTAAEKAAAAAKKKAAEAATKAVTTAASAAVKAQTTLSNEVLAAVKMPLAKGVEQLKALGVPANKATQVLKDAVKPFTDAVTSLEKAGFTAAEAVKIADAGQAELTKEAKANAAKTKAATAAALKAGADSLTALTVNGIAVSGSIYRAAIGAAYKTQTGSSINAIGTSTTAQQPGTNVLLQVHPGAIVVHTTKGDDMNTILDKVLRQLSTELRSGTSGLAVIR